jgi:L,D-transpeptidase YcbB
MRTAWLVSAGLAAAMAPLGVAMAQAVDPMAALPAPRATPVTVQPVQPVPTAPEGQPPVTDETVSPVPEAPVLPPPNWQADAVAQLVSYIRGISRDGLNPADYDPAGLDRALRSGDPLLWSKAATDRFNQVSLDLALGHVRSEARVDWHVRDKDLDATSQRALLDRALASGQLAPALDGLLPVHPQYGALRYALEVTPKGETATLNRIRLNMDRWRWLPRDLGQKYIIVNVPSFHATLVENGVTRWKKKAIAGAIKTPTPQLAVMATGVVLNPSWEVPKSIWGEVAGKPGFVAIKDENGKFVRWSQPAGPTNALGQLKFVMYNPYNIYLHDTNARSRFNSQVRALSHGCVRTEDVLDLATELLGDDGGEWTADKIAATLATKKSKQANFVKPLPVYIVYFSAAALTDGSITNYADVYKRDAKVMTALLDRNGKASSALAPGGDSGKKMSAR